MAIFPMGDFEDVFGAGADADSIIDGYAKDYEKASHLEKANWVGEASPEKINLAIAKDEFDDWCKKVERQGGIRGPVFLTYSDLKKWDEANDLEHIRRRNPDGYFQIYFFKR